MVEPGYTGSESELSLCIHKKTTNAKNLINEHSCGRQASILQRASFSKRKKGIEIKNGGVRTIKCNVAGQEQEESSTHRLRQWILKLSLCSVGHKKGPRRRPRPYQCVCSCVVALRRYTSYNREEHRDTHKEERRCRACGGRKRVVQSEQEVVASGFKGKKKTKGLSVAETASQFLDTRRNKRVFQSRLPRRTSPPPSSKWGG